MKQIGIVGGTGYTGSELLRLLIPHPHVQVRCITSRQLAGQPINQHFPNMTGFISGTFVDPDTAPLAECDLVFFATPHGIAMKEAPPLLEQGIKVIDLSADFRIKDLPLWEHWYRQNHSSPEWVAKAIYGLPETHRPDIRTAQLVANPGCHAIAIQLGLLPLMGHSDWIDTQHLIANTASGVSGAGRQAEIPLLLSEASDNFKAYGVMGHRHLPEIQQELQKISSTPVGLTFVPHLLPMIRGILATIYIPIRSVQNWTDCYQSFYQSEPFVQILDNKQLPETRMVKLSNRCQIAIQRPQDGGTLVVLSAIDNLVKGAAGQAVQNMNLMLGFPETTGLMNISPLP